MKLLKNIWNKENLYVNVIYNNNIQNTSTKFNTFFPIWNEHFLFKYDKNVKVIIFQICENKNNTCNVLFQFNIPNKITYIKKYNIYIEFTTSIYLYDIIEENNKLKTEIQKIYRILNKII
jgi:hypothetical protein